MNNAVTVALMTAACRAFSFFKASSATFIGEAGIGGKIDKIIHAMEGSLVRLMMQWV